MTSAPESPVSAAVAALATAVAKPVGEFVGTMLKVAEDLVGLSGGDWVGAIRLRQKEKFAQQTTKYLEKLKRRREKIIEPNLVFVMDVYEFGISDDRHVMQDLWAGFLASCCTKKRAPRMRREYTSTLRLIEPDDALLLGFCIQKFAETEFSRDDVVRASREIGLRDPHLTVARQNLEKQRLLWSPRKGKFKVSQYGLAFLIACAPLNEPQEEDASED